MSSSRDSGIALTDVLAAAMVLALILWMPPSPRGAGQQDGEGTFSRWVENLVPAYLSTTDFLTLMSAPGETLI